MTRTSSRIANRNERSNPVTPPSPPPAKKKKKTTVECSRDYKLNLKSDPERYEDYLIKAREYNQNRRKNGTCAEEEKIKQREQSKLRMREWRARKSADKTPAQSTWIVIEEQRDKWIVCFIA